MSRSLNALSRSAGLAALLAALWVGGAAAHWQANLDAANQVPSLADDPDLVGATAVFTMHESAKGTIEWTLDVKGISNMTMAHIHVGNASENGNVAVFLVPVGEKPGKDGALPMLDPPVSGDFSASSSFKGKDVSGMTLKKLLALADDAGLYVNVHTTEYPGGAIRGQIMKASVWEADLTPENQVPTPLTEEDVNGATAKFTLSMVEDADIYAYTLEVKDIENMTMAHIHAGDATTNGPVVVVLVPVGGMEGADGSLPMLEEPESGSKTYTGYFTADDLYVMNVTMFNEALMTDPSTAFYVNVHTTAYPAGAIRGQLMMSSDMDGGMGGGMGGMPPTMAPEEDPNEYAPMPVMAPGSGAGRIGFSVAALAAALAALLL